MAYIAKLITEVEGSGNLCINVVVIGLFIAISKDGQYIAHFVQYRGTAVVGSRSQTSEVCIVHIRPGLLHVEYTIHIGAYKSVSTAWVFFAGIRWTSHYRYTLVFEVQAAPQWVTMVSHTLHFVNQLPTKVFGSVEWCPPCGRPECLFCLLVDDDHAVVAAFGIFVKSTGIHVVRHQHIGSHQGLTVFIQTDVHVSYPAVPLGFQPALVVLDRLVVFIKILVTSSYVWCREWCEVSSIEATVSNHSFESDAIATIRIVQTNHVHWVVNLVTQIAYYDGFAKTWALHKVVGQWPLGTRLFVEPNRTGRYTGLRRPRIFVGLGWINFKLDAYTDD